MANSRAASPDSRGRQLELRVPERVTVRCQCYVRVFYVDQTGDIMDALLNDLNDLGVGADLSSRYAHLLPIFRPCGSRGDDLAPSSARLSQSLAPPAPYSIGLAWASQIHFRSGATCRLAPDCCSKDVETSASTWSPEECMELRRLVTLHNKKDGTARATFASSWGLKVKRVVRSGTSDKEQIWLQVR